MNDPRYEAIIRAATETRVVDFKAAMNWRTASKCEKFEILRDIAAMANAGGGHLIIGRDEPTFSTGSLTPDDVKSFDPTAFNTDVHNYLEPALECCVIPQHVDDDTLVVIEVPEFETSPLIFQKIGNCGAHDCKKGPHFRPGDIFVRSKAVQSRRIESADEMREVLNRAVRKSRDDLVTAMQRMLASPQSVEEPLPTSPYDAEAEHEWREFFQPMFEPWLSTFGHFDMTVKPVVYRSGRINLHDAPRKIIQYAVTIGRNGIFDAVPFEQPHESTNFIDGARLRLMKPEWRRVEGVSLHTSGQYRIIRAFQEDFEPNQDRPGATLVQDNRTLLIDTFVEQMTLIHLLARDIARDLVEDIDEEIQVDLRLDGLAGRTVGVNRFDLMQSLYLGMHGQPGNENVMQFPLRTTRRALEVEAVSLARQRCERIFWPFGLRGDSIIPTQRRLLGSLEPIAFPPP